MLLFAMDTPPDKLLEQIEEIRASQQNLDTDLEALLITLKQQILNAPETAAMVITDLHKYYVEG